MSGRLRYVEREVPDGGKFIEGRGWYDFTRKDRALQVEVTIISDEGTRYEWHDVPTEAE